MLKAEQLEVNYTPSGVNRLEMGGSQVRMALLESGLEVSADLFVNAAGAWANGVAEMAGLSLPVEPMCRVKHYWTCETELEPLPLVKDESALFFRPQGEGFIGGRPSWEIAAGFYGANSGQDLEQYFDGYFERVVRPLLQIRLPGVSSFILFKTTYPNVS
ncbi:MAG: FAD-dependent oxidoreductase [Chloroflexota bacterium]